MSAACCLLVGQFCKRDSPNLPRDRTKKSHYTMNSLRHVDGRFDEGKQTPFVKSVNNFQRPDITGVLSLSSLVSSTSNIEGCQRTLKDVI